MEDERVNFNIAKMAKMAGFVTPLTDDTEVYYYYLGNNSNVQDTYKHENIYYGHVSNDDNYVFEAPTLSELQKWLRETHKIDIRIDPILIQGTKKYGVSYVYQVGDELIVKVSSFSDKPAWCTDYESALRLGLIEVFVSLKTINKNK